MVERRHKEWLTLWNANCDAAQPKKRFELLHDLEVWERTQGRRAPTGRAFQTAATIKDKSFDGAAWAVKHDTSFKDLIARARKSRVDADTKAEKMDERLVFDEHIDASSVIATSQSPSSPLHRKDSGSIGNDARPDEVTQLPPSSGNLPVVAPEGLRSSTATALAAPISTLGSEGPNRENIMLRPDRATR